MATSNIGRRTASKAKQAGRQLNHTAANPWVEKFARFGYLVRGLVYATIGVLALQLAIGAGGQATTQSGAIAMLGSQPFGKILLILIVVGLASYSLWGFVRAIFDPLHRGSDSKGIVARMGFAFSGLSYGVLAIPPLQSLMNQGGSQSAANPADISVVLFGLPFGKWLVVGLGFFWIAIQFYVFPFYIEQEVKSYRIAFKNAALIAGANPLFTLILLIVSVALLGVSILVIPPLFVLGGLLFWVMPGTEGVVNRIKIEANMRIDEHFAELAALGGRNELARRFLRPGNSYPLCVVAEADHATGPCATARRILRHALRAGTGNNRRSPFRRLRLQCRRRRRCGPRGSADSFRERRGKQRAGCARLAAGETSVWKNFSNRLE